MKLFWKCVLFRLACSLCLKTAFAPDEFWQGPEIAHRIVFGYAYACKYYVLVPTNPIRRVKVEILLLCSYGHLTWEWAAGLRSYLHPLLYAIYYYVLKITKTDFRFLIFKGPQVLHSFSAAVADVGVFKVSKEYFGNAVARCDE